MNQAVVIQGKNSRIKSTLMLLFKGIQVVGVSIIFAVTWVLFYGRSETAASFPIGHVLVVCIFLLLYCGFARIYGGFQVGVYRFSELVYSLAVTLTIINFILFVSVWILLRETIPIWGVLLSFVLEFLFCAAWAFFAIKLYFKLYEPMRAAVVYENEEVLRSMEHAYRFPAKFNVVKTLNAEDGIESVLPELDDVETVFIFGVSSSPRNSILKHCVNTNLQVYLRPKIGDILLSGSRRINMFNLPLLNCGRSNPSIIYVLVKRAFDIIASTAGILLFSPFMLIIALLIKLHDEGPVLYKQCRLTKDGKTFNILKFRSMRTDAEKDGVARLASENDNRITPVGKVIRTIRFDELPQLLNILKGDMSIVGPRPERPEIVAQYEEKFPEFHLRLQVKAGLTGYAQVNGKYNTTPYDKLQMDLIYIANQSLVEDIKLMLMTAKVLLIPESTEGIEPGKITAVR